MKFGIFLSLLILLTNGSIAETRFQWTDSGWLVLVDDRPVDLASWLSSSGARTTALSGREYSLLEYDSKFGFVGDNTLLVPPMYRALGMLTYVGELGWTHSIERFEGYTGYQNKQGKWGLLGPTGNVHYIAAYDEILFDGHFHDGHVSPLPGMAECRRKAAEQNHQILAFGLVARKAIGYFDKSGSFVDCQCGAEQGTSKYVSVQPSGPKVRKRSSLI